MVSSAGLYVVIRERPERSTTQSAARNGLPNSICVPDPMGTTVPFSSAIAAASSATVFGRTLRPTEIPSMINSGTSQQHGFDAFADRLRARCRGSADFGTRVARWKYFGGIQHGGWVEDALHGTHHIQIRVVKNESHELFLLHADAMFAAESSARVHAHTHDRFSQLVDSLHLIRITAIKQNEWMQISITGMKDVGHSQAMQLGQPVDFSQHIGQSRAWNHGVHHHHVR